MSVINTAGAWVAEAPTLRAILDVVLARDGLSGLAHLDQTTARVGNLVLKLDSGAGPVPQHREGLLGMSVLGASRLLVIMLRTSGLDDDDLLELDGHEWEEVGTSLGFETESVILSLDELYASGSSSRSAARTLRSAIGVAANGADKEGVQMSTLELVRREMALHSVVVHDLEAHALTLQGSAPASGPAFQFADGVLGTAVYPLVSALAGTLSYTDDPEGAFSWWTQVNGWIGYAPAELLGTDQEDLIWYAAEQISNDAL